MAVFSPIFVVSTKITFVYNFVAPLTVDDETEKTPMQASKVILLSTNYLVREILKILLPKYLVIISFKEFKEFFVRTSFSFYKHWIW